jgi:protoheme IX farnesyltransferase
MSSAQSPHSSPWNTLRSYWEMTRPRVLLLVLVTGIPALLIGQEATPTWALAGWILLATGLSGASCSMLNAYLERDIDAKMARTESRPLPRAAINPTPVLFIGIALAFGSTWMLYHFGGKTAALVGGISIAFYVFVYTLGLKRRTPQNIVIGGAAGATAPLIADAAVDGTLGSFGWILFLIIFLWTPPHFWAIAIFRRDEYAKAELPMMNLVIGDQKTRKLGLVYTLLMIPVSLSPLFFGQLGWAYGAVAIAGGIYFTAWNLKAIKADDRAVDWKMFKASIVYLGLLFAAMIGDFTAGTPGI